jgi:hypothetical protein
VKKIQSLQRRNAVFAAAAVALVLVAVLRKTETSTERAEDLPPLFAGFDKVAPQAQRVAIEQVPVPPKPGATAPEAPKEPRKLDLVRRDREWVLASAYDHPVREGAVQRLLDAVARARSKGLVSTQADTFPEYADREGWVRVDVTDATGKSLAAFSVGKTANWPDVYVLRDGPDGKGRVDRVAGLERDASSVRTDDWIEALVWPGLRAEDVTRLDVEQRRDKRTMSFERASAPAEPAKDAPATPEATWKMVAPTEGEAIRLDVDGLVRSFAGLRATDVLAGASNAESDAKHGLDDPEMVLKARGKPSKEGGDPVVHVLEVGKKSSDGKSWYVRRGGQSWIYAVDDYALDPFRKDPASFLVKKDEPAKAEPPKDGAPSDGAPPADAPKDGEAPKDAPEDGEAPKDEPRKDEAPPGDAAEGSPDGK